MRHKAIVSKLSIALRLAWACAWEKFSGCAVRTLTSKAPLLPSIRPSIASPARAWSRPIPRPTVHAARCFCPMAFFGRSGRIDYVNFKSVLLRARAGEMAASSSRRVWNTSRTAQPLPQLQSRAPEGRPARCPFSRSAAFSRQPASRSGRADARRHGTARAFQHRYHGRYLQPRHASHDARRG